jgi:hypothetical protein
MDFVCVVAIAQRYYIRRKVFKHPLRQCLKMVRYAVANTPYK